MPQVPVRDLVIRDADLVVYCTPVDQIAGQVVEFAPLCKPHALVKDAGYILIFSPIPRENLPGLAAIALFIVALRILRRTRFA